MKKSTTVMTLIAISLAVFTVLGTQIFQDKSLSDKIDSCLNAFQLSDVNFISSIEANFNLEQDNEGRDQLTQKDLSCVLNALGFSTAQTEEITFSTISELANENFSVTIQGTPDCTLGALKEYRKSLMNADGKIAFEPLYGPSCYPTSPTIKIYETLWEVSAKDAHRNLKVTMKDFRQTTFDSEMTDGAGVDCE